MKILVDKIPTAVNCNSCLFAVNKDPKYFFIIEHEKVIVCTCQFSNKACALLLSKPCPYLKEIN